ncbi:hypothetical protein KPH14_006665 [Odynerus spinipes]|uniref:Protein Spindly n=1 Tax=Odynerus spinipes TaxID=1348599 RepID=A0AAD9VRM0_9HYME|nr:hypothetical protein KPH14_006665 [Odynerus spinipes]
MSDSTSSCNESAFTESKDEYFNETLDGNIDYRKLHFQNETYQQELHNLRLKLIHNEAMQRELQEANDLLEQSLTKEKEKAEKKLQEIKEKNRQIQVTYENQVNELGIELEKKVKENKELHNLLIQHKDEISQTKLCKSDQNIEERLTSLKKQMQELLIDLEDERRKKEEAEEMIKDLNSQLLELQEILQITKDNLRETNEILENKCEELALCRTEIETLKTVSPSESYKGNSLFAEVEDRRQVALNKAITLKKKYDEVKQAYNAKVEEVKLLKMEKAAILKEWENYGSVFSEDNDLINKYKSRIHDLEKRLIEAQKNNIETKITDTSFSYLESLLAEKKKEIQELHQKIEHDSIDMLVQAEIQHEIMKQLKYWKCKAMHMEAQLPEFKSQFEVEDFPDREETAAENMNKIERITSESTILKDRLPVSYLRPKNMLQTIGNADTSLQIINTRESTTNDHDCRADKSSNMMIDKNCLDYNNSDKSEFEDTKMEKDTNAIQCRKTQNGTFLSLNETQKSRKVVQFSEDTKSPPNDSMTKRKENEEKKKVPKQYKVMYISSESSK